MVNEENRKKLYYFEKKMFTATKSKRVKKICHSNRIKVSVTFNSKRENRFMRVQQKNTYIINQPLTLTGT